MKRDSIQAQGRWVEQNPRYPGYETRRGTAALWGSCRVAAPMLPEDLRERVGPLTLASWIVAEVERLEWDHPQVVEYMRQHPEYRPKMMLGLLSLAYAASIFSSEEIVRCSHTDAVFRAMCEGRPPFPHELAQFRRRNRALLERILTQVFLQVASKGPSGCRRPAELGEVLRDKAIERLNNARHLDHLDL